MIEQFLRDLAKGVGCFVLACLFIMCVTLAGFAYIIVALVNQNG